MSPLATPPPAQLTETGIGDILGAVRKNGVLVAIITAVSLLGAAAYGLSRTKIYQASSVIQIDPRPPRPLGAGVESVVDTGTTSYWSTAEYYQTQYHLISSKPVALAVVRELGLLHDRGFLANLPEAPPLKPDAKPVTEEQVAEVLMRRLAVEPVKESRLVEVTFQDASKTRATRVLDAVLRAYVAHNVNKTLESTSSAVEWLDQQLEHLQTELSASEDALHEYKLEKQIASIGIDGQTSLLKSEMEQLSEARTDVQTKIQEVSARLAQLKKVDPASPENIPQMELMRSDELHSLRLEYLAGLGARESLLQSGKGTHHPEVEAATARIAAARTALSNEVRNIQSGAERDLAALQQQSGGLTSLLENAEKQALDLNLMEIEYSRLNRTKVNNEKMYSYVLERSKEAGLTKVLDVNNIQTISPAATARSPVAPRLTLIFGAGGLLGFFAGVAIAFGRETMDRSIRSAEELEQYLGLLPLGTLPKIAETGREGRIAPRARRPRDATSRTTGLDRQVQDDPTSLLSEAVRAIRTNLLFMSPDHPFQRLLITSPSPAEGKTTVSCNLAIAMAQAGKRVLFVDGDLRRPRLEQIFPKETPGARASLSGSLLDPTRLTGADLSTNISNLDVLVAGPTPPNPTELLHSAAFRSLLDQVAQGYDLVVIDSPPLVVTDAAILANVVDGVVLVARAYKTHRSVAAAALRALRDAGGNVVGGVLNATDGRRGGYGYGYGYGYHAQRYGTSGDVSIPAPAERQ